MRRSGPPAVEAMATVLCLLAVACSEGPTGPGASSRDTVVLAFSGDTFDVQIREAEKGRLLQRRILGGFAPGVPPRGWARGMVAADRTLFRQLTPDPEIDEEDRELMALRLPFLSVARRVWINDIEARPEVSVQLAGLVGAGRTGERVYVLARRGADDYGLAVLDGRFRWKTFLGGFANEYALSRAGVVEVDGAGGPRLAVAAGTRKSGAVQVIIYDISDFRPRDSVRVVGADRETGARFTRLANLAAVRDGRHAYILTLDSLMKVDVRSAAIVARVRRANPSGGSPPMAVTTDPPRIFVGDRGSIDFPGSGELQVYDARDLSPLGRVEVVGSMNDIAVNREGDRIFVVAGTDPKGGFAQQGSLSVVDAGAMTRIRKFEFDERPFSTPKEVLAF